MFRFRFLPIAAALLVAAFLLPETDALAQSYLPKTYRKSSAARPRRGAPGPGAERRRKPPRSVRQLQVVSEELKGELSGIRAELKALRVELQHLRGVPAARELSDEQRAELAALETERAGVEARLAEIQAEVEAGADPEAFADERATLDERLTGIGSRLKELRPAPTVEPSLYALVQANARAIADLAAAMARLESRGAVPREAPPEGAVPPSEPPPGEPHAEPVAPALEFSGFGDVLYTIPEEGDPSFGIGQMEVDLEASFDDRVVLAAALAYDAGAESFGLGLYTIDVHLFGAPETHLWSAPGIAQSGVIVGQFDVPFGIDWLVYPSIDRKLVSGPLVVDGTHAAWNDLGAQAYVATSWFNAAVYAVNGFGYEVAGDGAGEDGGEPAESDNEVSFGTRVAFKPLDVLEIGGSFAGFLDSRERFDAAMAGGDLQFAMNGFLLKGEAIVRWVSLAEGDSRMDWGFYGQALYDFGPVFLTARAGMFAPEGGDKAVRVSGGAGWVVRPGVELRFEYQANLESVSDNAYLQLVAGF